MLRHLVRELESGLVHVSHGLQGIEGSVVAHGLARRQHAHIDILLVGCLDLLLLLLQELDLLLDGKLLHYRPLATSRHAGEGR